MATEAQLWYLESLRSARSDELGNLDVDEHKPVVLTIPAFQRTLVWSPEKQRNLIASILKGFPIGAILLVEHAEKKSVTLPSGKTVMATNYGIIDGLQRTNAIVEHLRQSLHFANADVLDGNSFDSFHAALSEYATQELEAEKVTDSVTSWMHETRVPNETAGFDFYTLLTRVVADLELPPPSSADIAWLKPAASALVKHIREAVDISKRQIPVLIYSGPGEYLPEIFEQINKAGTTLTKYEIYAASWVSTTVTVNEPKIRDAIARRYARLTDEGFTVEVDTIGPEYSLFDYLHGLSQYLGELYPRLFSKPEARKNRLTAAFPLATLMFGSALDKMGELETYFPKVEGRLQVDAFQAALISAVEVVDKILAKHLALQMTGEGDPIAHGELQIVSIIAAVASHLYDHTSGFGERLSSSARSELTKKFSRAIPQHYIYDVLRQQWRGSLYTYAYERVWDKGAPSPTYVQPVEAISFDSALATSLREQLAEVSHSRKNITAADRAFLKFLYSPIVSVSEQSEHKFDIEHWIPVGRIQKMTQGKAPWPIGALGNLGVLPAGPNRIKKEETVDEYLNRSSRKPTPEVASLVRKLILVDPSDLAINKIDGVDAMTQAQYVAAVSTNWSRMCIRLKTNLAV